MTNEHLPDTGAIRGNATSHEHMIETMKRIPLLLTEDL
jgi:hypothetical protein